MTNKLITLISSLSLVGSAVAQHEFDENGLPKGFANEANKSLGVDDNPVKVTTPKTKPQGQGQVSAKDLKAALDAVPTGKYIGKLPEDLYLQLSQGQEGEEALKLLKRWEDLGQIPNMTFGGRLQYTYGSGTPIIIVKPVELTSIELEEGERVHDILIGDSIRWSITPSISGNQEKLTQTTHLVVKAKKPNLTTSLVVTTNRRAYRMRLVSSAVFHMPLVGYTYPQDEQENAHKEYLQQIAFLEAKRIAVANKIKADEERRLADLENELARLKAEKEAADSAAKEKIETLIENKGHVINPLDLDFHYNVKRKKGRPTWIPTQVYNDGTRTYIVMPKSMNTAEAPIIVIKAQGKQEMVNYRLVDGKFVVDRLFEEALMLSGVGYKRQEVEVSRIRR